MKIITPSQSRGARGILNWSQLDLAERCRNTVATVSAFENGAAVSQKTIEKVFSVFDSAGIAFLDDDGVKRRNTITVRTLNGDDANYRLLDDVYFSLKDAGGEVLIAGLKEPGKDQAVLRSHVEKHVQRLKAAGITERILIEEGDTDLIAPPEWYRWLPKGNFLDHPFQLYGSKLALITWGPPQQIIVIDHAEAAESFRGLFNFAWSAATLVEQGGGLSRQDEPAPPRAGAAGPVLPPE